MRKIGNIELDSPLILAPMAGVTNAAFRKICKRFGASLTVAEMVSDKGLLYKNQKTLDMLRIDKDEHPVSMQIFGSEVDTLTNAAKLVMEKCPCDILDINMGCPVNKVVKSGAGSALLNNPEKIYEIIKSVKSVVNVPVSIKIRAGFDSNNITCAEVARLAEKAGVDAIAIHARTRSQLYRGEANSEYIKMVRNATNVFVIGNGDIKTTDDVRRMLDMGCDAVMIGRAALGNPWIFEKIRKELNGEIYIEPTKEEVIDVLLEHARGLIEISSEKAALVEMRTHAVWYFKKLPHSKEYRLRLVNISTYKELEDICNEYLEKEKTY